MGVAAGVQDTKLRALAAADPTIQTDEAAGNGTAMASMLCDDTPPDQVAVYIS